MTWIRTVEEADAGEELSRLYARIRMERGKVSEVMKAQSLQPGAIGPHLELYLQLMFDRSGLSREEREMIAIVVSAINGCEYCVRHHAVALNAYWRDMRRVERFATDYRRTELSERMRVVLRYANLLTRKPRRVTEEEVRLLRAQGLGDEEVLSLNLVVSYFNLVNRIALGLGVEASTEEERGYRY